MQTRQAWDNFKPDDNFFSQPAAELWTTIMGFSFGCHLIKDIIYDHHTYVFKRMKTASAQSVALKSVTEADVRNLINIPNFCFMKTILESSNLKIDILEDLLGGEVENATERALQEQFLLISEGHGITTI